MIQKMIICTRSSMLATMTKLDSDVVSLSMIRGF
jgi:hypothetical protein